MKDLSMANNLIVINKDSLFYKPNDRENSIQVVVEDDTIWVTQKAMSEIFECSSANISIHLKNIFDSGELQQNSVIKESLITASDGKNYKTTFYNLDAIISVGYRVNSQKATQFRVWATGIIKQYIRDGYIINEELLRSDPKKLNELAAKLRELRSSEMNIFSSVREVFKLSAIDYEPSSQKVRSFYALLQDKFHHAVTNMTASKLILDRADHSLDSMGVVTKSGITPTRQEALVGKNYLREDEMYRLHLLSEQFLLYAETTALRGQQKTMDELHQKLDDLLALNEYPILGDYKDYLRGKVEHHVSKEYEQYIEIKKLEYLGVKVDLEDFYNGEYDEYKNETSKITTRQINKDLIEKSNINKIENKENSSISSFNISLKKALDYNPKDTE